MAIMRVLLVDDDPSFREMMRLVLQRESSLSVTETSGGPQAWDLLQQGFLPDLCLLDIAMPEVSGMDLLERMRSHPHLREIKVILCTAVHDRQSIVKAASLGVHYYFLKPFSPSLMLAEIRNLRDTLENEPPVFEPERVQERLALDEIQFAERIQSLLRVTDQGLVTLKHALERGDRAAASWCLGTLSDASHELNARPLWRALHRLGAVFNAPDLAGLKDEIECVKAECRRLRYVSARTDEHLAQTAR